MYSAEAASSLAGLMLRDYVLSVIKLGSRSGELLPARRQPTTRQSSTNAGIV